MADDEKKRVKDEHHDHEHKKWQLSEEMGEFTSRLTDMFPELRITSGRRDGDGSSHHHTGDALDIGKEHTDVYDYLMNTQDGLTLMGEFGLGVIDETDPAMMVKTGATGPHFHIGRDDHYASQAQQRLNTFDEYYTFPSREGAKYKKDAEGKWTINLGSQTQNQYVSLRGDYDSRATALDKMAQKVEVKPDQVSAFFANNPTFDYGASSGTVSTDGSVSIDSPIPLEIINNAPEHVQHFMQDVMKEKDKNDINSKKTKQSEARKRVEEAKKAKAKKQQRFMEELSKMNTDGFQKEAAPSKQKQKLRHQKVEIDFQDQQKLPNMPSIFTIPKQ